MVAMSSAASSEACGWCGGEHVGVCPKVAAIEYQADGQTVKAVHFFPPAGASVVQVPETDDAYRKRLETAILVGTVHRERLLSDTGARLDELGTFYEMPRAMVPQ